MIVLSAGHNPDAPGACHAGFCEHSEAVRWVELIATQLAAANVPHRVLPTGHLAKKVSTINHWHHTDGVRLALEVHFNSATYAGRGCETLYCPGSINGLRAAEHIQSAIASVMQPDRGVHEGWYLMDKPGQEDYPGDKDGDEKPLYFLAKTRPVAVIIEPEFIQRYHIISERRMACCAAISQALADIAAGRV